MPRSPRTHQPFGARQRVFRVEPVEHRPSATKRGYDSRWRRARDGWLARHPLCARCEQQERVTPATVVDHIKPHRLGAALESGDDERIRVARSLFWDSSNWQSLCKVCHDSFKQAQERAAARQGRASHAAVQQDGEAYEG